MYRRSAKPGVIQYIYTVGIGWVQKISTKKSSAVPTRNDRCREPILGEAEGQVMPMQPRGRLHHNNVERYLLRRVLLVRMLQERLDCMRRIVFTFSKGAKSI
jgi:hypothetical protein